MGKGYRQGRGYSALRKGRVSVAGGTYFLTACVEDRVACLDDDGVRGRVFEVMGEMETDGSWRVRCGTVMPDHLHLVVELGHRPTLSQAVGRLKAKTRGTLGGCGARWQASFFDHRMDLDEGVLDVFCYVWRNAVRAGLVDDGWEWAGWVICEEDREWFRAEVGDGVEEPGWLEG